MSSFKDEQPKTTESIFSSSIETINTLGNILFTEKVSEFYLYRQKLTVNMNDVLNKTFNEEDGITTSYENLSKYSLAPVISICDSYKKKLEGIYEQCKLMMDVSIRKLQLLPLNGKSCIPLSIKCGSRCR